MERHRRAEDIGGRRRWQELFPTVIRKKRAVTPSLQSRFRTPSLSGSISLGNPGGLCHAANEIQIETVPSLCNCSGPKSRDAAFASGGIAW